MAKPKEPKIDPELHVFMPEVSEKEYEELRKSIVAEGIRDPLIVWEEKGILVDGHRRFEIAKELSLTYKIQVISFKNKNEVKAWMALNQLGRRNLNPDQIRFFRGKEYLETVKAKTEEGVTTGNVAASLAEKHGVSKRTIHNDAKFAEQVDASPNKPEILAGKITSRIYCDRCKRTTPVKGCERCAELAKEQGRKPKKTAKKQSGQPRFQWETFNLHFGKVVRSLDEIVGQYPEEKDSLDHKTASDLIERFAQVMIGWKKKILKENSSGEKQNP